MTPKEKALELFDKFNKPDATHYPYVHNAQQCALIAIDEILDTTATEYQIQYDNGEWSREIGYKYSEYWLEVKQEIEKL